MKNLIENYTPPAVLLENATKEELEVIKAFCIKHGYRVVDKPISRKQPSEILISFHEPYKTLCGEWIRCSDKKGCKE